MTFRVNLNPLLQGSANIAGAVSDVGGAIGSVLTQNRQQQEQEDLQAFMAQAMSGDPVALEQVYLRNPEAGTAIAQKLAADMEAAQATQNQFQTQMAVDTADAVERLHLAPDEEKEAIFQAMIDDPRYDIDEEDRPFFMDEGARKALVGRVKGKEYADNFFGKDEKFTQGTGKMSGYAFNEATGEFSINPNLKEKLEEAKLNTELDAKTRQSINKDFTQLTKDTKLIRNTAQDLEKLAKIQSGPASIAMVFKFMKALDPTSVVREGEFATAENSAGIPEALRNTYNKLMEGGRLGPRQIEQFVDTAKKLANSAIESSSVEIKSFIDTFEDTLPKNFKRLLQDRIPKPFVIKDQPEVVPEDPAPVEPVVAPVVDVNVQALEWANANPDDPRAAAILQKLKANL